MIHKYSFNSLSTCIEKKNIRGRYGRLRGLLLQPATSATCPVPTFSSSSLETIQDPIFNPRESEYSEEAKRRNLLLILSNDASSI